jgi:hypothetical protein
LIAAIILLVTSSLLGAGLAVTVETTPTQVVLEYTAPGDEPCRVEISESPSLAPLVHDVDPVLFSGADLDTRDGSVVNGRNRRFVAGKRTSERAPDGKYYSRALQVFTKHYYRIACGSEVASGSFHTKNPPLGNTAPELPPFDPQAFGNYAWPSLDSTDRNQSVIDPLTGFLIKRVTMPGDYGRLIEHVKFNFVLNPAGKWSKPEAAASGSTHSSAGYEGPGGEPLFLGLDPAAFRVMYKDYGGWTPTWSVDDIRVRAFGRASDADAANRTVSVCLSLDSGQSCATAALDIVLPQSNGTAPPVPAVFPAPMFAGWGTALSKGIFGPPSGKVMVEGSKVTLVKNAAGRGPSSDNFFKTHWTAGTRIYIANSEPACPGNFCTIANVENSTNLRIAETLPYLRDPATGGPVDYKSAASGLRVVKKTGSGQVAVSFDFDYATSAQWTMPMSGGAEMCSKHPAETRVDADGNPLPNGGSLSGYLCAAPTTAGESALYFIVPETGEVRLISTFEITPNEKDWPEDRPVGGNAAPGTQIFDPVHPNVMYVSGTAKGAGMGRRSIFKLTYTGDYRAFRPNYPAHNDPPDSIVWTNITPGSRDRDVLSQVMKAIPGWKTDVWGDMAANRGAGVGGKYFVYTQYPAGGGQNGPCWVFFFDVTAEPYAKLANFTNSFSEPSMRWAGCHNQEVGFRGYLQLSGVVLGMNGPAPSNTLLGPHKLPVTAVFKNGAWSSDTSIGADASACPADLDAKWIAAGASGSNCLRLRVRGEPCSATPNLAGKENKSFPCPWNPGYSMLQPMQEGDAIADASASTTEQMRIVRKTPFADGYELTVLRAAACGPRRAKANGWTALMTPNGICRGASVWLDGASKPAWILEDKSLTVNHEDFGSSPTPGHVTAVMGAYAVRYDGEAPASIGKPATFHMNGWNTKFAGESGAPPSALQSYPSKRQWNAPAAEQVWALDFRHYNPGGGSGPEAIGSAVGGPHTMKPVEGTSQIYEIGNLGALNPKRVPLEGFAGRWLLREKSGPEQGNTLTDADAWRFCLANEAGECRRGSARGQIFVNVPHADVSDKCFTDTYSLNVPCLLTPPPVGAWAVQWDVSRDDPEGVNWRRLTMGLSGPGRQYHFANMKSMPDGKWALFPGYWLDGVRNEVLLVKLPPWPGPDRSGIDRATFVNVPVSVSRAPEYVRARVRFGYAENGPAGTFYCTPRRDVCSTGGDPFAWESERPVWEACASGCKIAIPALSGRVLYYAVDRKTADGRINPGRPQVVTVP